MSVSANTLTVINELLPLRFTETVNGELKVWYTDGGGTCKMYLSADDCKHIGRAFMAAALELQQNGQTR